MMSGTPEDHALATVEHVNLRPPVPSLAVMSTPRKRLSFRRYEHLRRNEDFEQVYDYRKSLADDRLIIYARPNQLPHNRIGLSVSRKKFGNAVRRNRMRRLLREAYRLSRPDLPTGLDLIFIPRGSHVHYSLANLRESMTTLIPKLSARLSREGEGA